MSMLHSRYTAVRSRILELHNILEHRVFGVWVAPKTLMSTDQLRDRYEIKQEGYANDTGFYNDPQLRQMKIPQILAIMENMSPSMNDLGFNNANVTVTQIYESIQEYIGLWCEIIRNAPEFGSPPRGELKALENLAYMVFPMYKKIKPFQRNSEQRELFKGDADLNARGLAGLAALFSMQRMGTEGSYEISFISHLDDLDSQGTGDFMAANQVTSMGQNFYPPVSISSDSLSRIDAPAGPDDWIFRG